MPFGAQVGARSPTPRECTNQSRDRQGVVRYAVNAIAANPDSIGTWRRPPRCVHEYRECDLAGLAMPPRRAFRRTGMAPWIARLGLTFHDWDGGEGCALA